MNAKGGPRDRQSNDKPWPFPIDAAAGPEEAVHRPWTTSIQGKLGKDFVRVFDGLYDRREESVIPVLNIYFVDTSEEERQRVTAADSSSSWRQSAHAVVCYMVGSSCNDDQGNSCAPNILQLRMAFICLV